MTQWHKRTGYGQLTRTDSQNLAFIKGALLGMAGAHVISHLIGLVFRVAVAPGLTSPRQAAAWQPYFVLQQMLWPIGLLVGGIIARDRLQKSSPRL
jgi:hypothetical protein